VHGPSLLAQVILKGFDKPVTMDPGCAFHAAQVVLHDASQG